MSKALTDIVVRDCGSGIGFLGLVYQGEQEFYRTPTHYERGVEAFLDCIMWVKENLTWKS